MIEQISDPAIVRTLEKAHKNTNGFDMNTLRLYWWFIRDYIPFLRSMPTAEKRNEVLANKPMGVSKSEGKFLYALARKQKAKHIIEFGTSIGISTLYWAAAIRENGGGKIYTTELSTEKVKQAVSLAQQANLSEFISFLQGDARETLNKLTVKPDIIFLDGWKDLYLPVLHIIEKFIQPNNIIIADDVNVYPLRLRAYTKYVREKYQTKKINKGHGMLVSIPKDSRQSLDEILDFSVH